MKCRECEYARRGWFKSVPEAYVCIGVKVPFVISNYPDAECTEYPEYKDNIGNISIESAINHFNHGVTHDIFREPVTSYAKMAVEALEKQIPKKVVCEGMNESDYVYCPNCHNFIGSNEVVWDDFYYRDWKPMRCQECGQVMIWE